MCDPLGLVSPVVLQGRRIFQEATKLKLSWDDPVPNDIAQKWSAWLNSLNDLPKLTFDRCVMPNDFAGGVAELNHFCDGSQIGYGACAYLRVVNRSKIHVVLIAGKARLAPMKQITIPRLELSAEVLSIQLDVMLRRELDIPVMESFFWTDSEIVRAYIMNDERRFPGFVANRVSLIRQHSEANQWKHVNRTDNPADVASRGCAVNDLSQSWFRGPQFLSMFKSEWQSECHADPNIPDTELEVNKVSVMPEPVTYSLSSASEFEQVHPIKLLCSHYSSFYRLKKAVCWLLRLKAQLRKQCVNFGPITVAEMSSAENMILKHVQKEQYAKELSSIRRNESVSKSSPIAKLCPVIRDGLIVVGGRLKHASVSQGVRTPIISPRDNKVSDMVIREYHNDAHLGTEWVLNRIRSRFWIINARNKIKHVKKTCVTCKRLFAAAMTQKMADLPPERCQPNLPQFIYTGLDFFGPFLVKRGRSEVKRYGCVFSCFNTRALHLEKVKDLGTDAFLNAFVRFVSRRGCPQMVWSDNGTNLVGADAELRRCLAQLDRAKIVQAARRRTVAWEFNPALASHHGGVWERMIRTIRRILLALLRSSPVMNDDIMHTVLCETENVINSRPLTKSSDDVMDDIALTPNHLLMLGHNSPLLWGDFGKADAYRRHWRCVRHLVAQFWRRWIKEYSPLLQQRPRWSRVKPNLDVGSLVLIMDENVPRGVWPLGLVTQTNVGRDGLVRSARLRIKSTTLVRPISKLVFLEGSQ